MLRDDTYIISNCKKLPFTFVVDPGERRPEETETPHHRLKPSDIQYISHVFYISIILLIQSKCKTNHSHLNRTVLLYYHQLEHSLKG